jgi:hypothetical protein
MRKHPSYFVVVCDYGKRGLEAIVHPELTKRAIVEMIATGEAKHVAFIHHVEDGLVEDVTDELFDAAESLQIAAAHAESVLAQRQQDEEAARVIRKITGVSPWTSA